MNYRITGVVSNTRKAIVCVLGLSIAYIGLAAFTQNLYLPSMLDDNFIATISVATLMFASVFISKGTRAPHLFVLAGIFGTFFGISLGLANYGHEMQYFIRSVAASISVSLIGLLIAFIIENISAEETEEESTDDSKMLVKEVVESLHSFKHNADALSLSLEQINKAAESLSKIEAQFQNMPTHMDASMEKWQSNIEAIFVEHLELLAESAKKASSIHFNTYKGALDSWADTFNNAQKSIADYSQFVTALQSEQQKNNDNTAAIRELLTEIKNKG